MIYIIFLTIFSYCLSQLVSDSRCNMTTFSPTRSLFPILSHLIPKMSFFDSQAESIESKGKTDKNVCTARPFVLYRFRNVCSRDVRESVYFYSMSVFLMRELGEIVWKQSRLIFCERQEVRYYENSPSRCIGFRSLSPLK